MSKISPLNPETATGKSQELLVGVKQKLGVVPNLLGVLANAPEVLEQYLSTSDILGKGALSAQVREKIAIAIATENDCEYCLSAHTAIGKSVGVDQAELSTAQVGISSDPKTQAIIDLALIANRTHGHGAGASDAIDSARSAGLTDQEILETVSNVVANILTNTVNGLVGTVVDFPKVELVKKAA